MADVGCGITTCRLKGDGGSAASGWHTAYHT